MCLRLHRILAARWALARQTFDCAATQDRLDEISASGEMRMPPAAWDSISTGILADELGLM